VAVAPAAPAVPALAYLVIGLLALLAWAIQRGLLAVWVHTFGAMLQALANLLVIKTRLFRLDLGGPIRALDDTVRNALVNGAKKAEHLAGYFFHGCAVIARWMAREIEQTANDVADWAEWFQHAHLPKWVKALVYATFPPALIARLVQAAIHANLPHVARTTTTKVEHVVTHTVTRIVRASSGAVAIPGWVIRLPSRVGDVERDLSGVKARLKSLEKYAGATAAVALFTAAIAKLGLKWIRCRNVKRTGKAVCGMDASLLESLLGDALLIVGTLSVVTFAKEMLAIEDEAVAIMRKLVKEIPG
jgi:hypothetical protein